MRKSFTVSMTPEDDGNDALEAYMKGPEWKDAMRELADYLRAKAKYEDITNIAVQTVRDELFKILQEHGLDL